jgi:RecA-family ATPase
VGDTGGAVLHCHAGCEPGAVVAALGLITRDLFADDSTAPATSRKVQKPPRTFLTWEAAAESVSDGRGKPSMAWEYHDAQGDLVGVACRWNLPDGKKSIRPVSRQPDGSWAATGMAKPRPLYRLPDVIAAETVYVCEGEKAADAIRSLGLIATTSSFGAKAPHLTDWSQLVGKKVVILPDHDEEGEKYAVAVLKLAIEAGAASAVIVHLADIWHGIEAADDAYDWIDAHDAIHPADLVAALEQLAARARKEEPTEGPILVCMADVEPREVSWLWHGRVPLGRITLLVGRPKEGKSFLTTDMASRVTTGTPWPDGSECPKGSVILISAEDDPHGTIRPRLDAHYADANRVHLLKAVRHVDEKGTPHEVMFTLEDIATLEKALASHPDCKLVVIDPIGSFLGGRTNAHRDNEVRAILAPVARLAEKYGVAVLVVCHTRKSPGTNADEQTLGSRGFVGIARAVWHMTRDSEDKSRRLLLPGGQNLAGDVAGLAFTINGEPARLVWEREPVAMSADDALAAACEKPRREKPGPAPEKRDEAVEWLTELLADGPGLTTDIIERWTKGEGGSKKTLIRAKKALGVEAYRPKNPGPWWWRLPVPWEVGREQKSTSPKEDAPDPLDLLGKTPGTIAFPEP